MIRLYLNIQASSKNGCKALEFHLENSTGFNYHAVNSWCILLPFKSHLPVSTKAGKILPTTEYLMSK